MAPTSGRPGTVVTLSGAGLYSPSGLITVMFGPTQAPVSCPRMQLCTVQVPARVPGEPGRVPVTVITDTGRSAPLVFTYR
jgi:hypothetical protein